VYSAAGLWMSALGVVGLALNLRAYDFVSLLSFSLLLRLSLSLSLSLSVSLVCR
jgi:hypothetical protein